MIKRYFYNLPEPFLNTFGIWNTMEFFLHIKGVIVHALLWLHFSLVNGGVEIQTPVRLDRNRHGGGVILYVLKTILVLKKNLIHCMYVPYIEII